MSDGWTSSSGCTGNGRTDTTMSTSLSRPERIRTAIGSVFERRESSVMVGLIAIFAIGVVVDPQRFLTLDNLFRVLRSAAIVSLIGYGMAILDRKSVV